MDVYLLKEMWTDSSFSPIPSSQTENSVRNTLNPTRILYASVSLTHIHPQGLTSDFKNIVVKRKTTYTSKIPFLFCFPQALTYMKGEYLRYIVNINYASTSMSTQYYGKKDDDENIVLELNLSMIPWVSPTFWKHLLSYVNV